MHSGDRAILRHISALYRIGQSLTGRKLESAGIGSGQSGILLTLHNHGGVSQEELAAFLKLDKGCIAKSVKKLERAAFVQRCADAADKRAYKVSLTQKGLDAIPLVIDTMERWENYLTSGLTNEERQSLERLLGKMVEKAIAAKTSCGENV